MRYATVVALIVIVCTVSVAHGGRKISFSEADILASEVMSNAVYRNVHVLARAEDCRLHISFESLSAAFDLPLQGTMVVQTATEDGILVMNRNMTRTIRGRSPESFERLALRFPPEKVQVMLKTFNAAIASCGGKG